MDLVRRRNMKTNKQQAILFIIFSILFFLITDSTFYTAYKERNTKTLFVKYIVADSPNQAFDDVTDSLIIVQFFQEKYDRI